MLTCITDHNNMLADYTELDPDGDIILVTTSANESEDEVSPFITLASKNLESDFGKVEVHCGIGDGRVNFFPTSQITGAMTFRTRVSSRHLSLASPVFKAMLTGGFEEGRVQSTQVQEIQLPDDDPEALVILLHVIHGLMWKVPRQLDLQTLLEISILVDKYQLQQVVAIVSELWIDHLWESSAKTRTKTFVQWICISWVFGTPLQFEESTKVAIREITCSIEVLVNERFPIPSIIAGMSQGVLMHFTRC